MCAKTQIVVCRSVPPHTMFPLFFFFFNLRLIVSALKYNIEISLWSLFIKNIICKIMLVFRLQGELLGLERSGERGIFSKCVSYIDTWALWHPEFAAVNV